MRQARQRCSLYRFRNAAGDLLYVGISRRLNRRIGEHERSKPWWDEVATIEVRHYPSEWEARIEEGMAIWLGKPRYNIADAGPVPDWVIDGIPPGLTRPADDTDGRVVIVGLSPEEV